MTVRPASSTDREAAGRLWVLFLEEQAQADARLLPAGDALARWRNEYPDWLRAEERRLFVAEEEGALAGFASVELWSPPPIYRPAREAYLDELYVRPELRGRGTGRALLEAVRGWARERGAERLRVGVAAANAGARAFWRKAGADEAALTLVVAL